MWAIFAEDVFISALILFVPGYFFARALRFSKIDSLCLAPFPSSLLVSLASFSFSKLGIEASFMTLFASVVAVCFCLFALSRLFVGNDCSNARSSLCREQAKTLSVYIAAASIVSVYVFVKTLDGGASFNQEYDNYSHLNTIRGFIDSGVYSYDGILEYPFAFYCISAMVANVGAEEVTVAVNALNFAVLALVWPAGVYVFLKRLFAPRRSAALCGALCCVGFVEFPWGLITFGPLYPNAFSYMLLPAVMAVYIGMLKSDSCKNGIPQLFLFLIGCASLVFAHPNAIFAGIVILTPFTVSVIFSRCTSRLRALIGSAIFISAVLAVWVFFCFAPAFRGVVQFNWPMYLSGSEAIGGVLSYCLTKYSLPQFAMAILVFAGCCVCIVEKRNRWMTVSLLLPALMLVVASSSEGPIKHLLAGFWYTDTFRIAAVAVIASIPLASIGLEGIIRLVKGQLKYLSLSERSQRLYPFCLILLLVICVFIPSNQSTQTPFGKMRELLSSNNSQSVNAVYDKSEIDFVQEAKKIVPDGSVVVNIPFDGSFLSYGVNGFKVAYSELESSSYYEDDVDSEGKIIRSSLCDYASNNEVRSAAEDQGVQYVLLLDQDDQEGARMFKCAKDLSKWRGIAGISDETEGFEVVLAEGDMRLYRLTGINEG